MTDRIEPMATQIDQQQLAQELVDKARADGVELVGPDGILTGLTKSVLETALEEEMTDHVGYDKHDPDGRNRGNSRNGTRAKTVLTEIARSRSRSRWTAAAASNRRSCGSGSGG